MREKSSKMTDFACLGRSTDRFERNLVGLQDFVYIEFDSELRKIGSQAKQFVLKDFAGKFGALFFIGFGYKIDAPIWRVQPSCKQV